MNTYTVAIDGVTIDVPEGTTILDAARQAGIDIPTLCFDERLAPYGACRVCMVGVMGLDHPVPACTSLVLRNDLVVDTKDPLAHNVASQVVELVLSELPGPPEPNTELARVAESLQVTESRWSGAKHEVAHDGRHPYLMLRHELCISCGRCVRACDEIQGAFALTQTGRGFHSNVTAGIDAGFRGSTCVSCGACAHTCPTGAISEHILVALNQSPGQISSSQGVMT